MHLSGVSGSRLREDSLNVAQEIVPDPLEGSTRRIDSVELLDAPKANQLLVFYTEVMG